MAEFWLVSVPPDKNGRSAYDSINQETASISVNFRFTLPELKVFESLSHVRSLLHFASIPSLFCIIGGDFGCSSWLV